MSKSEKATVEDAENKKTNDVEEKNVVDERDALIEKLNASLEEQKKQAQDYYDGLRRNMAEFDNYKKRINKERDNMHLSIVSDVIANMLPVIDNFEKAVNAPSKDEEYKQGIELIYKSLIDILKKYNVEKIEDLGSTFDPEYHEAVMSIIDDAYGEKEIVEVFRTGYKMGDKVVRHSLVKVAN